MAVEAMSFLLHQLTGSSRMVDAGNLFYWPLGYLSLVIVAQRLGARSVAAYGAASGIALIPLFIAQGATAYVDAAFACCVMAAIAASLLYIDAPRRSRLWGAMLLGLSLGLLAGSKGLGIPFAGILLALILLIGLTRPGQCERAHFSGWLAASLVPLFAVGSFWWLRNWLIMGNPIYPVELKLASWTLFPGVDAAAHLALNLPTWLEGVPRPAQILLSWLQPNAPIISYGATSGLGYLWLLGGQPAALLVFVHFTKNRQWTASRTLLFCTCAIFLLLQPAAWWGRFTLWLHILGLPCLAIVIQESLSDHRSSRRILVAVMLLQLTTVGMWESMIAMRAQWKEGTVSGGTSYVETASYLFPGLLQNNGASRAFSAKRIGRSQFGRWGTLLGGALSQPLGQRQIVFIPNDLDERDLDTLIEHDVQWIIWDLEGAGPCPDILRRRSVLVEEFSDRPDLHLEFRRLIPSMESGEIAR
jgi:4-amino-4-deoxy-L-arabinose transferase-like glycosyltransferase